MKSLSVQLSRGDVLTEDQKEPFAVVGPSLDLPTNRKTSAIDKPAEHQQFAGKGRKCVVSKTSATWREGYQ